MTIVRRHRRLPYSVVVLLHKVLETLADFAADAVADVDTAADDDADVADVDTAAVDTRIDSIDWFVTQHCCIVVDVDTVAADALAADIVVKDRIDVAVAVDVAGGGTADCMLPLHQMMMILLLPIAAAAAADADKDCKFLLVRRI